ncbi:hypothetical protein OHT68_35430 [Streptomyces canus]|nr:hypothetical protein [Streptomyces canus]
MTMRRRPRGHRGEVGALPFGEGTGLTVVADGMVADGTVVG